MVWVSTAASLGYNAVNDSVLVDTVNGVGGSRVELPCDRTQLLQLRQLEGVPTTRSTWCALVAPTRRSPTTIRLPLKTTVHAPVFQDARTRPLTTSTPMPR